MQGTWGWVTTYTMAWMCCSNQGLWKIVDQGHVDEWGQENETKVLGKILNRRLRYVRGFFFLYFITIQICLLKKGYCSLKSTPKFANRWWKVKIWMWINNTQGENYLINHCFRPSMELEMLLVLKGPCCQVQQEFIGIDHHCFIPADKHCFIL